MAKASLVFLILMFTSLNSLAFFILGEGVEIPALWEGNMKLAYSYFKIDLPAHNASGSKADINSVSADYKLGLGQSWAAGLGLCGGSGRPEAIDSNNGGSHSKLIGVGRLNLYGRWNFLNEDLGSNAGILFGSDFGFNYTRTDLINAMGMLKALLIYGFPMGPGNLNANLGFGFLPTYTHVGSSSGGSLFAALGYVINPTGTWHFPLEAAYAIEHADSIHPDLNLALSASHELNQDIALSVGAKYVASSYLAKENHQISPRAALSMDLR